MPRRLDDERRAELLDGVMRIIAARGFAEVQVSEMARELHCSVATLYRIAPSKDSLVLLAIARWGELALADLEVRAQKGTTASERARLYFRAGAEKTRSLSLTFYADVDRFESTRLAWWTVCRRTLSRPVRRTRPDGGGRRGDPPREHPLPRGGAQGRLSRDAQRASPERHRAHPRTGGPRGRFAPLGRDASDVDDRAWTACRMRSARERSLAARVVSPTAVARPAGTRAREGTRW